MWLTFGYNTLVVLQTTNYANGFFHFVCELLFLLFSEGLLFAGFLLASFVVQSVHLFWGMVVRGLACRDLC